MIHLHANAGGKNAGKGEIQMLDIDRLMMWAPDDGGAGVDAGAENTDDAIGAEGPDGGQADAEPISGEQEPAKTFTQAELDAIVTDRLARADKKAKAAADKAREEAERKAAEEQGEFKKLYQAEMEKREKAEAEAHRLEVAAIKQRVASATGLPDGLAARLQGETEEDITADAKTLMASLPSPALNNDGQRGVRDTKQTPQMSEEEINEFAARMGVDPKYVKPEDMRIPK